MPDPLTTFALTLCLWLGFVGVLVRKALCHRDPSPWLGQCAECSPEARRRQVNREWTKYRRVWRLLDEDWE